VTRVSETVQTGRRLGRYRLAQVIGQGGMGVVHLALDEQGRAVAVKVLRPHVAGDPDARERLAREVDTLTRVRSPRVAEVLDADVDCDTPYVVTRYVPAPPLDHYVTERGPLAGEHLARLGAGLGEALAAIHAADVVHRDLKPGNVLMLEGDPVVIDFGIAHVADDIRLTSTGLVMGTPGYLSPELVEGAAVREAADWWGWAATMTYAATGRPPFGRGPLEVVLDRVRRGAPDLDGVPAVLVPVLAAALSPDPADRPKPGALRRATERLRADSLARPVPPHPLREASTQVLPAVPAADLARTTPVAPPPAPLEGATAVVPFVPPTRAVPQAGPAPAPAPTPTPAQTSTAPLSPWPATAYEPVPQPTRQQPAQPLTTQPQPTRPQHLPQQPAPQQHHPFPPVPVQAQRQADPAPFGGLLPFDGDQAAPPAPAPPRPGRTGTLLAGLVLLVCLTAAAPLVAVGVGLVWLLLARTVDAASGQLLRRRYERGARRGDRLLAVVSSPWHLLVQVLLAVPVLLLPALVAASAAFIPGLFVAVSELPWGTALVLATAALGTCLTAWWGPGGGALRRGSRQLARGLAPGRAGSTVAVLLLLGVAATAVVLLVASGWVPEWAPLADQPVLVP
jgi:serine/threonine protein kinase